MATAVEGWHSFKDGVKAYTKTWKPAETPKAKLVFVHGFSDHCNAYYEFFPTLASRGIEVLGFDQRGWGRTCSELSASNRGHMGPTALVMSDLSEIISTQLPSNIPLFLMGHSMGGGETLTYASKGPHSEVTQIRGFLVESPLIGLDPSAQPSKLKLFAGELAAKMMPKKQLFQKLNSKALCRDVTVQKDFETDPLCHNIGTLECFAGMLDRGADLEAGRVKVAHGIKSLWVGHGTSDLVTSCPASRKWFATCAVEDKELREYEGWYHKLHGEPGQDRYTFYNEVADWILARSGSERPSSGAGTDNSSKARL